MFAGLASRVDLGYLRHQAAPEGKGFTSGENVDALPRLRVPDALPVAVRQVELTCAPPV